MSEIAELSDYRLEATVIGTLVKHPEFLDDDEQLNADCFFSSEDRNYYLAIKSLHEKGIKTIDAINLEQAFKNCNLNDDALNMPSIQESLGLYELAARDSIEEFQSTVNDLVTLAFKRDLVKSLDTIRAQCFSKDVDLPTLSHSTYASLDKVTDKYMYGGNEVHTIGEEIDDIWDEIVSRRNKDGGYGLPSKFPTLSHYFTYEPGELVVIEADRKAGKSAFLMNEAVDKVRVGVPTLVVDTEMRKPTYVSRLLSHLSAVSVNDIKNGTYDKASEERIEYWRDWLKEAELVYIYDPFMTMEQLYTVCKTLKTRMNLGFVVYDYMKSNEKSTGDNYNVLGAMCDFLKNKIAGNLNLPVLSAAQLNRSGEIADSLKINMYASVAVKWGMKNTERIMKDGDECGNAWAKVCLNRLGESQFPDDEDDFIDFIFSGSNMTIQEAHRQHSRLDTGF